MDLNDLRRDRTAAADAMQTLATQLTEAENADAPDQQAIADLQGQFDAAEATFDRLNGQVQRAESVEAAAATRVAPEGGAGGGGTTPTPAQAVNPEENAIEVGFMAHALMASKGDRDKAVERLEADGHSGIAASLSGATDSAGGVTVPTPLAERMIGLLQPRVTVRASGAVVHPMPAGEIVNSRMATGPTASYEAENAPIPPSEPTFDKVDENFKKLTCLVPIGNSLLRHSSQAIATIVRDAMVREMALTEDVNFLRADGSGNLPTGLLSWVLPANWGDEDLATPAAVEARIRWIVNRVEDANVPMISPGWIMRASTKNFLASLKDPASGAYLFPSILQSGTLMGFPIRTTSQIPNNLGGATDETEVYFADFSEIMIGDAMTITMAQSNEATYVSGGTTHSAFQRDETLMRAISEHDLAPMHREAIAGAICKAWSL